MSLPAPIQAKDKLHKLAAKGASLVRSEGDANHSSPVAAARERKGVDELLVLPPPDHSQENSSSQTQSRRSSASHSQDEDTVPIRLYSHWTLPGEEEDSTSSTQRQTDLHIGPHQVERRQESSSPAPHRDHSNSHNPSLNMWGSQSTPADQETEMAEKYVLRVSAGPSYDRSTHVPVPVNSSSPVHLSAKSMEILLYVRIRDFTGLPRHSPSSQPSTPYFSSPARKNDQYSIGFSFVPKRDISSEDLVWGNDFDHPVRDRLPPGFNTAFRIVKEFIDPGLECDAHADEPWLYGPALSCWFAMDVGPKLVQADDKTDEAFKKIHWPEKVKSGDNVLEEGDSDGIREALGIPSASQKRRKHFLKLSARQAFHFEKGRLYSGDFFNPYLDFNKFALRLPGFSLGVLRYIGDKTHTLRYVFKEFGASGSKGRAGGEVFFVVEMTLLFGDDASGGIREDLERGGQTTKNNGQRQPVETSPDDVD